MRALRLNTGSDSQQKAGCLNKNAFGTPALEGLLVSAKDEDPTGLLNEGVRYRDLETGGS